MSTASPSTLADDELNRLFHALADRTRRAILHRLAQGPTRISDLAKPFDMSLAAVGKHIRLLESVGLVRRRIVGRNHICALDADAMRAADDWLAFYRGYWSGSLDALADYVESMDDDR